MLNRLFGLVCERKGLNVCVDGKMKAEARLGRVYMCFTPPGGERWIGLSGNVTRLGQVSPQGSGGSQGALARFHQRHAEPRWGSHGDAVCNSARPKQSSMCTWSAVTVHAWMPKPPRHCTHSNSSISGAAAQHSQRRVLLGIPRPGCLAPPNNAACEWALQRYTSPTKLNNNNNNNNTRCMSVIRLFAAPLLDVTACMLRYGGALWQSPDPYIRCCTVVPPDPRVVTRLADKRAPPNVQQTGAGDWGWGWGGTEHRCCRMPSPRPTACG